jgi:hypothetical protein
MSSTDRDPFLRPIWEDTPDETDTPALVWADTRPHASRTQAGEAASWLAPLAAAQDALARLDAKAETVPAPVRTGLVVRLAFREAAGFLAARDAWVHPLDLALRALDLAGRFDTAAQIGRPHSAMPNTFDGPLWRDAEDLPALAEGEQAVTLALHLVRMLAALPRRHDPLASPETAAIMLGPFGARALDPARFTAWRRACLADETGPTALPPLLAAARVAETWMTAGIVDQPDAIQALAVAALHLVRSSLLKTVPLPVWAAWPVLGQSDAGELPRLRGEAASRLTGSARASWIVSFLVMTAEAARAGLRELDRLQAVAAAGARLTAGADRRSRLPDAVASLLAVPALTPKALAVRLRLSPQAATRLLTQLAAAGLAREVTGRKSFRAFAA